MSAEAVEEVATKSCPNCREIKPATERWFYRDKNSRDGLMSWCKTCNNARPRPQTRNRLIRVRARNRAMQRLIDLHPEQFAALYESERADAIEEDERLSADPENAAQFDGAAIRLRKGRRRNEEDPEVARIDENWCARCSAYHSRDHHEKPEKQVSAALAEFNAGTERARKAVKR